MQGEIKRDGYLKKLIAARGNGMVKVITGIRRCGKSYLLFKIFRDWLLESGVPEEQIIEISLEDVESYRFRDPEVLYRHVKDTARDSGKEYYLLLDEAQYAITRAERKNKYDLTLYSALNGLLKLKNLDVYVTGSNSRFLSKDVLTSFRGRGWNIHVYPLSFREFFEYRREAAGEGEFVDRGSLYDEYELFGGLPFVALLGSREEKGAYLKSLFDEIYFRDILERYTISDPDILSELTDELCSAVGSLTNANKIARAIGSVKGRNISQTTIQSYLDYLSDAFLFSNAKRYDVKGKHYFEYPSKYYCSDTGLRNARLSWRQQEASHNMENIIYNELVSRGFAVDVGVVEAFESVDGKKLHKQYEIDFVVNNMSKRYYIQSAMYLYDGEKAAAERRPLMLPEDSFRRVIISKDASGTGYDSDGILHIRLEDFLLDESLLDF